MKKYYVYIVGFIVLTSLSCKDKTVKPIEVSDKNTIDVEVIHSAGDKWAEEDNFLPLPFNVARAGDEDILVLGRRIESGENVVIKPLGAIRIMQNDTLQTFVISLPQKAELQSLNTEDFDEFSTVYSGAKWIVEHYMLNRKNSHGVKLKSWENENFAIKYLLK